MTKAQQVLLMKSPETVDLGLAPTRIERYPDLESRVDLRVKHDDEADSWGSGSKLRKLQYLLGHARSLGASHLICDGVARSNSILALAHYTCRTGFGLELVIKGEADSRRLPQSLLLAGANLHFCEETGIGAADQQKSRIAEKLRKEGKRPYLVRTGLSNPETAFAGMDLAAEILAQTRDEPPDVVVLPAGTGGLLMGVEIGRRLHSCPWRVLGVAIDEYPAAYYESRYREWLEKLEKDYDLPAFGASLQVWDALVSEGYASYSEQDVEALLEIYRRTGVYLDTTYMYKCLKGLRCLIGEGMIADGSRVLLLHTGGTNELFAPPYELGRP